MEPARKKKKSGKHVTRRMMLPLPENLYEQLRILAERNCRPMGWEVQKILMDHLAAEGLWPPPGSEK
jgi:hypothetical protein